MDFKAEHTVSKILKYLAIAAVVGLVLLWVIGGGVQKIIEKARSFQFGSVSDALSPVGSFADFRLPWQIEMPAISMEGMQQGDFSSENGGQQSGNPSPYAGQITIAQSAARTQSASGQYLELRSTSGTALAISGWSLESVVSGARGLIPQATRSYTMGRVNSVGDVMLAPGGSATVATGASPVGVSFQENMCTGYLGTLQPFTPALERNCPSPLSAIPRTSENETRLGTACFMYLSQLAPCTFPQNPPDTLSPACRSEIQNKLSYNGCVNQYKNSDQFFSGSWRVYLALGKPLWGVDHDIIRLLDAEGRVVNVLNY